MNLIFDQRRFVVVHTPPHSDDLTAVEFGSDEEAARAFIGDTDDKCVLIESRVEYPENGIVTSVEYHT